MTESNEQNAAQSEELSTPEAQKDFKPTALDNFLGYFVGTNFAPHYTRQDVNHINSFSSFTFVSVAMATAGSAMALSTGLGVPPWLSAAPLALGFTQLDRSFVRMEIVERTDARQRHLEDMYPDPDKQKDKWDSARRFFNRIFPVSLRMSMALCTSFVTGNIIIEKMAEPEIKIMADAAVTHHNKRFVVIKDQKEAQYNTRINQLEKAIDDANRGILTATLDIAPVTRLPADNDKYKRSTAAIDSMAPQIARVQTELLNHQKAAHDEETGAKLPGRSGIPTCSDRCNTEKSLAHDSKLELDQLLQQQAAQQRILDEISKNERQAVNDEKSLALKNADQHKTKTESLITEWKNELRYKIEHKSEEFEHYEKDMKTTPGYSTTQSQRGLFNDMFLFEKFQLRPGGGAEAKALAFTGQTLVFLFEMAAVLGAATRPVTPSEDRDAEIRAQERSGIRNRVRDKRLEEILEEREFRDKVTPPRL